MGMAAPEITHHGVVLMAKKVINYFISKYNKKTTNIFFLESGGNNYFKKGKTFSRDPSRRGFQRS
jgi:hypothetical protein